MVEKKVVSKSISLMDIGENEMKNLQERKLVDAKIVQQFMEILNKSDEIKRYYFVIFYLD